jgi:hypothetical protein
MLEQSLDARIEEIGEIAEDHAGYAAGTGVMPVLATGSGTGGAGAGGGGW